MKKIFLFTIALIIFNCQYSIVHCQSWKELMDSTKYYKSIKDYQSALKWVKLALPQAEKEIGINDTNYITGLELTYNIFEGLGKIDSSIFYAEFALKICRDLFKEDNTILASSLDDLGYYYNFKGQYQKAEPLYIEAYEMRRRLFKTDHPDLATSISNLGAYYKERGDYKKAEPLYIEALEMRRRLFNTDHPRLAQSISNMASFYNDMGEYKKTEQLFIEAYEMRKRLFKTDNPDIANSLNNLGYFYDERGDFKIAEGYYKQALEMRRRLYRGDHPSLAKSINNMAAFLMERGDYRNSEPLYFEALEMYKRFFKSDHPSIAETINNLAVFYYIKGDYKNAEPLFLESLEMRKRLSNADNPNIALAINNLADFYRSIGNDKKAESLFIDALEMLRRVIKTDHPILASTINNLSLYYLEKRELEKTETLCLESMNMFKRLYKTDHPSLVTSMNIMAGLYKLRGDYKQAELFYSKALEMSRRIFKSDHPDLANSIKYLAGFYQDKGSEYRKAELLFLEAIDMNKRIFKSSHPDIAIGLGTLAFLYEDNGNFDKAEQAYIEALIIFQKVIENYFPSLSDTEKEKFWNKYKIIFEGFNSIAFSNMKVNPKIICKMYDNQLLIKAILLNSSLKIKNRILYSGDSSLIKNYYELAFTREQLAKYYLLTKSEIVKNQINLDSVENYANDLEKKISLQSEDYKQNFEKKKIDWHIVQATLKSSEVALEIVRFRFHDNRRFNDKILYAAIIISEMTKEHPELVLLDNGNDLEGKYISEYRQQIEQQKIAIYNPEKIQSNLENLYTQFWAPIQEKLKGIKKVYLSLDGVYNQINLNTLINPKTGKYLLDELDLRIVTSTRDLVEKKNTPFNPLSRGENTAELFGDPQFNLDSTKYIEVASRYISDKKSPFEGGSRGMNIDSTIRQGISSLPGTRKEIEKIASDMRAKNWKVNIYLGEDALEEAIKAVKSPRVLHIATHGKFLKDLEIKEERSFGMKTQRYVENPLLRSMLLFAGAGNTINPPLLTKERGPGGEVLEDGLLTAYEAMNLNLDNTELVVLSACETGLGEIKNGEGVYGLQRAFQVAGAKSLIMSLWSVSDEATQELMSSFYDKWLSGKTKREAFREAQKELKKKYPGFYYWGAFVMVGE